MVNKIIKSSTAIVDVFYKFIGLTLDLIFLSKPFSVKCNDIISNAVKRRVKDNYCIMRKSKLNRGRLMYFNDKLWNVVRYVSLIYVEDLLS